MKKRVQRERSTAPPSAPPRARRRENPRLDAFEWEETFKAVPDLLAVVDADGHILRVNHAFAGYGVGDLVGRHFAEVLPLCAGSGGEDLVAQALRTRQEASAEIVSADLEQAVSLSAFPVHGDGARVSKVVLSMRDVTARRRMEMQLFQSTKLAAVGEMAAGVAHELNSPLTAIIGNAGLLLRRTPEEDRAHRMLSDIKTCGQRCKKIITDMLTFARQDSYVFEPLHLNDVVLRGLDLIEYQLGKGKIDVQKRLGTSLPLVLGNAQQIEQVLVNLLLNAKDALEDAPRKTITVTTDYGTLDSGHLGLAVGVADSGAGIGAAHLEKIFNPFFTTKEETKGTGLGLSVSLGIAKAHGGTIAVESRPGAGSTFTLVLPLMAQQIADYLGGGTTKTTPGPGLPMEALEELRPALELARRLGSLRRQLGAQQLSAVEVEGVSPGGTWGTSLMTAAALEGLLADDPLRGVTLTTSRVLARERGLRVTETASASGTEYAVAVRLKTETQSGRLTLGGAVFSRGEPRLTEMEGVPLEAPLAGHLLLCQANDRPGLVGGIASLLAAWGISILQMRSGGGGDAGPAVAVFHLDSPVGDDLLAQLRDLPSLTRVGRASLD